jgi:6-phosphofructokinase 1
MKNSLQLMKKGLNVITLPKTIDNDVAMTDMTFGFDTALGIAVDAIDRLHSTAHSHHRIIVVEIMGHRAGWLALGSGIAGGADVILVPEIPYNINVVAESILQRARNGSPFSIVAVAEGALSIDTNKKITSVINKLNKANKKEDKQKYKAEIKQIKADNSNTTLEIAHQLEEMTQLEARVTILGHLQRGGTPSAADRLLATRLGTACADYINEGKYGIMVASKGNNIISVPLDQVAGKTKLIPTNHDWIKSARNVGTCLGDV